MNYGTVCSGVEAFGPAWEALGLKCSFHAEIAPHPAAVLRYHYPSVPNYGDFTTIQAGNIDLLAGGTPCQDFSPAGLRAGLAGSKGSLTLEFAWLAQRLGARWLVWENVPGVLSADEGRAFPRFLAELAECGYYASYRVLDAQYFGSPGRRERLFLVAYHGDWRPSAAVLFDRQSLRKVGASDVAQGKEIAYTLLCRTRSASDNLGGLEVDRGRIRSLTPRERERLMGWPDDWTRFGINADGQRYELTRPMRNSLTGNGWSKPVAEWIGERIMMVERLLTVAPNG